jgi:hypothetical protein
MLKAIKKDFRKVQHACRPLGVNLALANSFVAASHRSKRANDLYGGIERDSSQWNRYRALNL